MRLPPTSRSASAGRSAARIASWTRCWPPRTGILSGRCCSRPGSGTRSLRSEVATYTAERFARTKRSADRVLDALLATAHGHPQRAMLLAHRLWDEVAPGKAADEDDWQTALARTRNQVAAEFDALWRGLEANEQRALRAIALFPDAPYGARAP